LYRLFFCTFSKIWKYFIFCWLKIIGRWILKWDMHLSTALTIASEFKIKYIIGTQRVILHKSKHNNNNNDNNIIFDNNIVFYWSNRRRLWVLLDSRECTLIITSGRLRNSDFHEWNFRPTIGTGSPVTVVPSTAVDGARLTFKFHLIIVYGRWKSWLQKN